METIGALLMGPDGDFINSSDYLMDGGVTAAYWFSDIAPLHQKRLVLSYGEIVTVLWAEASDDTTNSNPSLSAGFC
jgi:hypothetical protein